MPKAALFYLDFDHAAEILGLWGTSGRAGVGPRGTPAMGLRRMSVINVGLFHFDVTAAVEGRGKQKLMNAKK